MRLVKLHIFDLLYKAYHAWPRFYDSISQLISIGQWERWQDRVFDDLEGKKILEVGVGPGRLLIKMSKKGFMVTGVEIRKGMAYEARRRLKHAGFDVDIVHTTVYKMPFKDDSFDCIVMTFVLAEIFDLEKAIKEMKRVLKKNGKIIIIAGGRPLDNNPVANILFKFLSAGSTLKLDRDNRVYFEKHGFKTERKDFGPFNVIHKIVAVKS